MYIKQMLLKVRIIIPAAYFLLLSACIKQDKGLYYQEQVWLPAFPGAEGFGAVTSGGDALSGKRNKNIILDHLSMSWGMDETNTFYYVENYTVQWCIISESLYDSYHHEGSHGMGWVVSGIGATAHHNLCAHHDTRNPRFSPTLFYDDSKIITDFRNNVIYNWGRRPVIGVWYINENFVYGSEAVTRDNWDGGVDLSGGGQGYDNGYTDEEKAWIHSESPAPAPAITQQTAEEAFELVLEMAGAIVPKLDKVDERIIQEVRTGTAQYGATYNGGGKGIIDPKEPYTNLERYLAEIAESGPVNSRLSIK